MSRQLALAVPAAVPRGGLSWAKGATCAMHSLFAILEVRHSDAAITELFDTAAPFGVLRIRTILGSQFSDDRERAEILTTFPRVSGDADYRIHSSNHCNSATVFLLNIKYLAGKRACLQAAEMSRQFPT